MSIWCQEGDYLNWDFNVLSPVTYKFLVTSTRTWHLHASKHTISAAQNSIAWTTVYSRPENKGSYGSERDPHLVKWEWKLYLPCLSHQQTLIFLKLSMEAYGSVNSFQRCNLWLNVIGGKMNCWVCQSHSKSKLYLERSSSTEILIGAFQQMKTK